MKTLGLFYSSEIDTSRDVRDDMPVGKDDPDKCGRFLYESHEFLWSKHLPSGKFLDLKVVRNGKYELHSKLFGESYLTSDSIIHTYRKWRQRTFGLFNFSDKEDEEFIKLSYTIGGYLVFPGKKSIIRRRLTALADWTPRLGIDSISRWSVFSDITAATAVPSRMTSSDTANSSMSSRTSGVTKLLSAARPNP